MSKVRQTKSNTGYIEPSIYEGRGPVLKAGKTSDNNN